MAEKIAVVTGGNKGIGLGIVKKLCQHFNGIVYLTARNVERGKSAVAKLDEEGLKPRFYELDITNRQSIEKFRDYIQESHGGIDLLINNAAIAFKVDSPEPFASQAEQTINVNYYGLLQVCDVLFPLLRENARVVNLSSSCGHLSRIPSENLRDRFAKKDLSVPELSKLMDEFVESAKNGTNDSDGWGSSAYNVSKVGVSALTFLQNRESGTRYVVNCVHPGYVATDMSSHKGIFAVDRGVLAPLYLALEAPDSVRGVYMWHDKSIIDWFGPSPGPY